MWKLDPEKLSWFISFVPEINLNVLKRLLRIYMVPFLIKTRGYKFHSIWKYTDFSREKLEACGLFKVRDQIMVSVAWI